MESSRRQQVDEFTHTADRHADVTFLQPLDLVTAALEADVVDRRCVTPGRRYQQVERCLEPA
ncbi:MAG: hypothetical protein ACXWZX_06575, partial [Mycobacterium sp.]